PARREPASGRGRSGDPGPLRGAADLRRGARSERRAASASARGARRSETAGARADALGAPRQRPASRTESELHFDPDPGTDDPLPVAVPVRVEPDLED